MANHLVAFADILGFKSLVEATESSALAERVWGIVEMASANSVINWNRYIGDTRFSGVAKIESLLISDSILFWSEPFPRPEPQSTRACVSTFINYIADVAFYSFLGGLPLRIGMSCGDLFADRRRRLIIGQGMVDAYLTEQAQQWIGAAFHPSFPLEPGQAVRWKVPTKTGQLELEWALEWFSPALRLGGDSWRDKNGTPFRKRVRNILDAGLNEANPPSVRVKYRNTSRFFGSRIRSLKERVFVGGNMAKWHDPKKLE